ncbi:MAG: hypothetical protein HUJ27_03895 [Rhodobacteraceae bacterium]|nr:hypothetical protein [Paracoccaceae bacterium]
MRRPALSDLRILLVVLGVLITPVTANAQGLTADEVRAMAYAGDFAGLDIRLQDLQTKVAQGQISADAQRDIYATFATTDPRMHRFVRAWLEGMPGSAHANTAQAQIELTLGWYVRGPEFAQWTYPDAMEYFRRSQASAIRHAETALKNAPDLIPASDLMILMAKSGRLPRSVHAYLADIMERRPNYGSLSRGLTITGPNWGGDWDQVVDLCSRYALMVPDSPGYGIKVCQLDAALSNHHDRKHALGLARLFDSSDAAALDRWRAYDAVYLRPDAPGARDRAAKEMMRDDFTDLALAESFDRFTSKPEGLPSMPALVFARLREKAREGIEHDPYNPDYLEVLGRDFVGIEKLPDAPSIPEQIELKKRSLMFQPYHYEHWAELAALQMRGFDMDNPFAADPYFINAIVYSNYHPQDVAVYLSHRLMLAMQHMRLSAPGGRLPEDLRQKALASAFGRASDTELLCPYVRIQRIWEANCARAPGEGFCTFNEMQTQVMDMIAAKVETQDLCASEKSAPLPTLLYQPIPLDRSAVE